MNESPLWQAEDVVRALQGRCLQEQSWVAGGVSSDSRATRKGDLFIALSQGALYDGHDEVAAAFEAGAVAALVSHRPLHAPPDATLIFVEDTFEALVKMARMARARAQGKIVAVTGSVGKSSVKDMLRLALGAMGTSYVAPAAVKPWDFFLALANLPPDAAYAVFELNDKERGLVASLSRLVRPDIAIVTAIEPVRLGRYDSIAALADIEAEVFQGVAKNGAAILGADNPFSSRLALMARKCGIKKVLGFSTEKKADAALSAVSLRGEGSLIDAVILGKEVSYSLGTPGRHNIRNSLAALLTASVAGGRLDESAAVLAHYTPSRGTPRAVDLPGGGQLTLIDESGDASLPSVLAAVESLALRTTDKSGRRILVLGEISELGLTSPDLHIGLVPHIKEAGISLVYCCGDAMRYLFDALPDGLRGAYADTSDELAVLLSHAVRDGDIVWVKGPRDLGMDRAAEVLASLDPHSQHQAVNG